MDNGSMMRLWSLMVIDLSQQNRLFTSSIWVQLILLIRRINGWRKLKNTLILVVLEKLFLIVLNIKETSLIIKIQIKGLWFLKLSKLDIMLLISSISLLQVMMKLGVGLSGSIPKLLRLQELFIQISKRVLSVLK